MVDTGLEGTIETEPPLDLPLRNNLPLDEAEQLPEAQELATEELVAGHVPPAHSAPATTWPKPIAKIKLIIKTS